MTRSDLLTKLARRTNKNTTLDTATQNRLVDFLNERHRRLLSLPGAQRLRDQTTTFATVANQVQYALVNVARIYRIYEPDNRRVLSEISRDQWRAIAPDTASLTGTPEAFVWVGLSAVAKQPSDASAIYVKSTSASDTGTCYLECEVTGGYPLALSVTMTGTTAVQVTGSSQIERITKWHISATAVGNVTLHEDSGAGTQLGLIVAGRTSQEHQLVALYPTPDAAVTHYVDYQSAVTDLATANAVPVLPEDFHDVLLLGALMDEYSYMDDSRYAQTAAEYRERLGQFQYYLAETASRLAVPFEKPSRLGPWFASGV